MPCSASIAPNRVTIAAVAAVVALWSAGSCRAQGAAGAAPVVSPPPEFAAQGPASVAARFPDVVLKTHEGKPVRFYDDLVKGKIVMINFMYATCKGR